MNNENLYRLLYPMRIVLISAAGKSGESIMPAAWCCPLSFEPPLFGVAIGKKRFTYKLISESGAFALNIAAADMEEGVKFCGGCSGKERDKFKETGWKREQGKLTVMIGDAPASIECKVIGKVEAGDHILFIGEAVNAVKRREAKGLYHFGGDVFGPV